MEQPLRRVLLYGKSVILGTLEASLKRFPYIETRVLSAPFPTVQELRDMAPDVVIFDVSAPRPEAAFALLETFPGLLLIGLDASRDEMLVLSSHPAQALSVDDLVNVIQEKNSNTKILKERTMKKLPTTILGDRLQERNGAK